MNKDLQKRVATYVGSGVVALTLLTAPVFGDNSLAGYSYDQLAGLFDQRYVKKQDLPVSISSSSASSMNSTSSEVSSSETSVEQPVIAPQAFMAPAAAPTPEPTVEATPTPVPKSPEQTELEQFYYDMQAAGKPVRGNLAINSNLLLSVDFYALRTTYHCDIERGCVDMHNGQRVTYQFLRDLQWASPASPQ